MKASSILVIIGCLLITSLTHAEEASTTVPSGMTDAQRAQQMDEIFRHLSTQVYGKALVSKDWVTRCVAMISLSRLPHPKATDQILEALGSEKNPVARCVLWQVMLARAPLLTQAQYDHWVMQTGKMMSANDFAGDLRIGLLEFLSIRPLTSESRKLVQSILLNTNSLDPDDLNILKATGIALRAWSDLKLVDSIVEATKDNSVTIRAQVVLKSADVGDIPLTYGDVRGLYRQWLKTNGKTWAGDKVFDKEAYKKLLPQFVPAPVDAARIDPFDKQWREELEISAFKIKSFDFCFALDLSPSMSQTLSGLKRDMQMVFNAIEGMSDQSRISYATYAGKGPIGFFALSNDLKKLRNQFANVKIETGGDAQYGAAVGKLIQGNSWNTSEGAQHVIVIITDDGLNKDQLKDLEQPVSLCIQGGVKIYPVLIASGDEGADDIFKMPLNRTDANTVPTNISNAFLGKDYFAQYGKMAELTKGRVIDLWTRQTPHLYMGYKTQDGSVDWRFRLPSLTWLPPVSKSGNHNARIIEAVLLDAVNPEYRDRMSPFVKILVAYAHGTLPVEKEERILPPPITIPIQIVPG